MSYNYGLTIEELERRTSTDCLLTKKMLDVDAPEFASLIDGDKKALSYLAA